MPELEQALQHHMREIWIARGAIVVTAALNAFLINDLTIFPSWLSSVVELTLLAPLSIATAWTHGQMRRAKNQHHWAQIHHHGRKIRRAAVVLTVVVTLINFQSLFGVTRALLYGAKGATGQSLLIDALNIWVTNIVVFALWYWNIDRGGPAARGLVKQPVVDFMFPQMNADCPGHETWKPSFFDYVFVSFTNATAFSPTDTLPLSARAKLLFMVEAFASLLTVGLVAARAVNILS